MTWYHQPTVASHTEGQILILRITGDWTRDLPTQVKRAAAEALQHMSVTSLIIDLTDISFIDSWGEERFCDLLQWAQDNGGFLNLVEDPSRTADYEGLAITMERRELRTNIFTELTQALAAARGETK